MSTLRERRCTPCTGATPRLGAAEIATLEPQVPDWTVRDDRLRRKLTFRDFVAAIAFVNRMAEVAEAEQHHPDFTVHYREVEVSIWTHAVGGLSENDFILAAKIDGVIQGR
jgi:4a-hydroxytetrahydrobiopterin dehydratase